MKVREYCKKEESTGHDEGGYYRLVEKPEIPQKLRNRMPRCSGCYCAFYNGRANINGNTCWSLPNDENFQGRGQPKCWTRG